jgi:peptidyl-prolyl cis-trans isomerase C
VLAQFPFLLGRALMAATVVVSGGGQSVSLEDVDARVARIPAQDRGTFMDSPRRIEELLRQLLTHKQLAARAREAGLDQGEDFEAEVRVAVNEILARRYLEHIERTTPRPDFEKAARERYLADASLGTIPENREVSHILVSTQGRSEAEALAKARQLRAQLLADPSRFEALAESESDDPSAKQNRGRLGPLRPEFVEEFNEAARRLAKVGDISEPVRTSFGFHLIRLDRLDPPRRQSFEEARPALVMRLEQEWLQSLRRRVLDEVQGQPIEADPDLVASLRWRYLPPEIAKQRQAEYEAWKKSSATH